MATKKAQTERQALAAVQEGVTAGCRLAALYGWNRCVQFSLALTDQKRLLIEREETKIDTRQTANHRLVARALADYRRAIVRGAK